MVAGHLQIKKDYYYMVLNLKTEDGKRRTKWLPTGIRIGGKKNLKAAEAMLLETRHSYKDPIVHVDASVHITSDMLFSDYMLNWLGIIKNSVEEDTYAGYESIVKKRVAPYFAKLGVTLESLTALDIEGFYKDCFITRGVKGTTVQRYHANIHKALKYAVRHDLIVANPMEKVERPKAQQFTGAFYSVEEVEQLFEAARGDPAEFPILMAAFYGLRRSEIMGLRWQAVDFASNTIRIEHTVVQFRFGGEQRIVSKDRMKNKSSCRTMPLVPQFRRLLLQMQERQKNCRELCGNCYTDTDYIYVNDLGQPYKPNYVTQHFKILLRNNGLRDIRFHDLRHTCASLLLKNGVSMKEIQEWLGHSNFSTTANTYAHLDTTAKSSSAERMTGALPVHASVQTNL